MSVAGGAIASRETPSRSRPGASLAWAIRWPGRKEPRSARPQHPSHAPHSRAPPPSPAGEAPAIDPVYGMKVDPNAPKGGHPEHAGLTYAFCNPRCRERFRADPERYLSPAETAPEPTPAPGRTSRWRARR
ncbi:YHS domain-containing protein [Myxococcus virescens]|uniref:YHS domain-containing protein n=2 Tax=Myxococcus virescens TaxID=83456 RepID=UPI0021BEFF2C|nr:YHS domain-containing protein [Myxococcus virescens]